MSTDNRTGRKILAIVWRSFLEDATEDKAANLGKALSHFVFRRLPGFLTGTLIPREGLVDRRMLAALLGYEEESARKYAGKANARTFSVSKGEGYDLTSLTENLLNSGDSKHDQKKGAG